MSNLQEHEREQAGLLGTAIELDLESKLAVEIDQASSKAMDALGRYKFQMFGYWAAIWVHLNRIQGKKHPSPFSDLVQMARRLAHDGPYQACPDCHCTDVEMSAWVTVNDELPTGDEGPTDQVYCPQCADWGFEGHMKWRHLIEVERKLPFDGDREMPAGFEEQRNAS